MKRNLLLLIGILAIIFPMNLNAQEGPKISGFVQGLYQAKLDKDGKLMDGDDSNTLRMRRVRVSVEGKLTKTISYKIQGDFSRSPMMVDAFVKYKPCKEFAIQVGQFKTPFSIESPINPVNLEIFDYGESVQKLVGYSDVCGVGGLGRDIGIMASGDLFQLKDKDFALVNYSIGVFNGNGVNVVDNNNRKDIVGRLEIHPMLKAITLSGSYYWGSYRNKTVESEIKGLETGTGFGDKLSLDKYGHGVRNRWAAGLQYNDGNLMVRGEYLCGTTGVQNLTLDTLTQVVTNTETTIVSNGYYAVAGYNFKLGKDGNQKLMPVLRYEHFAKDALAEKGGTNYYTVGVNYWPIKSLNFKLDYSLIQPEKGDYSHRIVGILSYKF